MIMSHFNFFGQAYGLEIYSDFALPELLASPIGDFNGIIHILRGETPTTLANGRACGALCEAEKNQFLLSVPKVGSYYVTPDRIVVSPATEADDATVRLFLFGSAIGALLHMRGVLALHASAVALPDGTAAAFCGVSTAGKSTLAAALSLRGYESLADDIVAIHFVGNGGAWIYPGVARTKLWGNALDQLGLSKEHVGAEPVRPGMDKYYVRHPVHSSPLPISRFYELSPLGLGDPVIEPISGKGRIEALISHTYRPRYLKALACDVEHMHRLMQLAPRISMSRIVRHQTTNTITAIVDMLERSWL